MASLSADASPLHNADPIHAAPPGVFDADSGSWHPSWLESEVVVLPQLSRFTRAEGANMQYWIPVTGLRPAKQSNNAPAR